jgi:alpha-amylase
MRESALSAAYADCMRALLAAIIMSSSAAAQPTVTPAPSKPPVAAAPRSGPDRENWWNDRVFYEIFVRSFADSTQGPLAGDGIGDLQGLVERLDYLNDGKPETTTDLGIGGIWLMPIMPAPSYHGYDITDYYEVNPQYGTVDDFKRLMAECHKRGINVIIDLVMNHCSHKHEWFAAAADARSSKHDWFIWSDRDPGWKGPWNQRVWHRLANGPADPETYYYGLFSHTMPDLNFRNPAVGEAMRDICLTWLSRYKADGFRLDAIRHLIEEGQVQENTPATHAWLKNWLMETKGVNPDAMTIGEVWADSEQASSYVGSGMDLAFEFALGDAIIASAKSGNKDAVVSAQRKVLALYPPNQYGRFLSNHDQTRVMTQLKSDAGAMRTAAALLLLGPGVPFIYYGEEIGMTGDKPDELLRTPMQWTSGNNAGFTTGKPWAAVNAGYEALNVEKQREAPDSLLSYYRKLIHLRNGNAALATGGTWIVETSRPEVVAFLRHKVTPFRPGNRDPQARGNGASRPAIDAVLVLINLSDKPVEGCTISVDSSPLRGTYEAKDELGGQHMTELRFDERGGIKDHEIGTLAPRAASSSVLLFKP